MEFALDAEQQHPIDLMCQGKSVFITGSAGTGKSATLQSMRTRLPLTVTASTGLAAMNVGGSTYHSWSGIGYGGDPEAILKRISKFTKSRIVMCNYLALDEVSMVSGFELDTLSYILSHVRADSRPFGGITMAFLGDFMQLPPVDDEGGMAFESESWQELNPTVCKLTKIYRQENLQFQQMLEEIRFGKMSRESTALLASRINAIDPNPELVPLRLYCTNRDVDYENERKLGELPGAPIVSEAEDWADHAVHQGDLDKNCRWPATLQLKEGARVMLLQNRDVENGLANGSMGVVESFSEGAMEINVRFDVGATVAISRETFEKKSTEPSRNGWVEKVVATRRQFPLRLAYAFTSHKCQGLSLDKIEVFLADVFSPGQAYVALSRARSLGGLFIGNSRKGCIKYSKKAADFYSGRAA